MELFKMELCFLSLIWLLKDDYVDHLKFFLFFIQARRFLFFAIELFIILCSCSLLTIFICTNSPSIEWNTFKIIVVLGDPKSLLYWKGILALRGLRLSYKRRKFFISVEFYDSPMKRYEFAYLKERWQCREEYYQT